jgi:branched-chain amino acid transport system permease protein
VEPAGRIRRLISIGQQMFVGIGIYTLLQVAEVGGLDPFLAVLASGVVAAVLSVPVALFAFRLKGGYFAIGTWVVAEVFHLLTMESSQLRGGDVRSLTRASLGGYSLDTRTDVIYWLALTLAAGSTAIVVLVLRSRLGLALRAVRDSEDGARGLGVDVTRTRVLIWVLAAFWTGCTGAVILLNTSSTTAGSGFSVLRWTALVIFIVVIGGIGSTTGAIIGVGVFWLVDDQLADAENWRFIVLGAIAVVMAIAAPRGIYGLLQRWRPLQFFPVRRRLVAASAERAAASPEDG